MTVRTRFAPSPTGYLHIGGARTALFSWLYARKHGGQFVLRIEDTDRERSTQAAVDAILDGMKWLDLDYDEGPIFQMDRMERYQQAGNQLLKEGKAYRCDCSKERLEALRETQMANQEKPRYDGHCRERTDFDPSKPHVIRFKNPQTGQVVFNDLVRGEICVQNAELDDLVLVRTDGIPTYNFAVVIDDADMKMTTVIRGDDHINNTPRQINLFHALGLTPPAFGHVPMILGGDGKRLSKRHGAVSVTQYRDEGFLSKALVNYLVRLGWSHGDQEIFTIDEMIQYFDVSQVNHAPAAFNSEKLLWLNQHYLKTEPLNVIMKALTPFLSKTIDWQDGAPLADVVAALRERAKTLVELADKVGAFYSTPTDYAPELAEQYLQPKQQVIFEHLTTVLSTVEEWTVTNLHEIIQEVTKALGLKMPELAIPVRVALLNTTQSPSLDQTLYLLGKERVLAGLKQVLKK